MHTEPPRHPTTIECLGLWLLATASASLVGAHGIVFWDAGEYVILAIDGGKSGLLLGRPLFVWTSQAVAAGVDPANVEAALRWFWTGVSATASPAMARLAARIGLSPRAALLSGAALAMSPSFAHVSHQVMTDGPALALSIVAVLAAASGRAVAAGAFLAAAIATRETAAIHVISIVWLLGRRRAFPAAMVCALALAGIVAVYRPPGLAAWFGSMAQSASTHAWSARDFLVSVGWVFAAGPLPVIAGLVALTRGGLEARTRAIVWPAFAATILLLFYPDGSFSPRYVLAAVPLAFFLTAAPRLAGRPGWSAAALAATLVISAAAIAPANATFLGGSTLRTRVRLLPHGALVVPGHFCPEARLAALIANRRDLTFVCPGWTWPGDSRAVFEAALREGRSVAIDQSVSAWIGPREIAPRDEVREWLASRPGEDIAGFTVIRP